jgi:hypothetical protein
MVNKAASLLIKQTEEFALRSLVMDKRATNNV